MVPDRDSSLRQLLLNSELAAVRDVMPAAAAATLGRSCVGDPEFFLTTAAWDAVPHLLLHVDLFGLIYQIVFSCGHFSLLSRQIDG